MYHRLLRHWRNCLATVALAMPQLKCCAAYTWLSYQVIAFCLVGPLQSIKPHQRPPFTVHRRLGLPCVMCLQVFECDVFVQHFGHTRCFNAGGVSTTAWLHLSSRCAQLISKPLF